MINLDNVDCLVIFVEVMVVFYQYEEVLVSNNIEVLDVLFWYDLCIVWLGVGENLYGIEVICVFCVVCFVVGLVCDLCYIIIIIFGVDMVVCSIEFICEGSVCFGCQQ